MIIYLNGTSSAGKSAIAKELQTLLEEPIFNFSIDTLLYSLSNSILEAMQGKRKYSTEINWNAVFQGYFECVAALQIAGNSVIADCPVYMESLQRLFEKSLAQVKNKLVVGINCPIEVLRFREQARGDRVFGLAERQFGSIHKFLTYDLIVDSHINTPEIIAKTILQKCKEKDLRF